jgi:hypothetical protein
MLRNSRGNNTAARLNLVARCEEQRAVGGTHYLSHADMEFRTGLKRTAIIESNKALEDAGLIVKQGKTRDGVDIYSINTDLVRDEGDLADIRANLDRIRSHRKEGGTPDVPPGTPDVPGTHSEPLPGTPDVPGGTHSGRKGYARRTQTSTQYITVKEPGISDASASSALFAVAAEPKTTKGKSKGEHEDHPAFAGFWKEWCDLVKANGKGRTGNRLPASKAFTKAMKNATPEEIAKGVRAYLASEDPRNGFNQNASTWLNEHGWETPWMPYVPRGQAQRHLQTAEEHPDDPFAA